MSLGRIRGENFDADVDVPRSPCDMTAGDLLLVALDAHTATPVRTALYNIAEDVRVYARAYEADGDLSVMPLLRIAYQLEAVAELARRLYGDSAFERDDEPRRESA